MIFPAYESEPGGPNSGLADGRLSAQGRKTSDHANTALRHSGRRHACGLAGRFHERGRLPDEPGPVRRHVGEPHPARGSRRASSGRGMGASASSPVRPVGAHCRDLRLATASLVVAMTPRARVIAVWVVTALAVGTLAVLVILTQKGDAPSWSLPAAAIAFIAVFAVFMWVLPRDDRRQQ